jgi:hypothetical protein
VLSLPTMPQVAERPEPLPMLRAKRLRLGRPPKPWEGDPIAQRTDEYRYIYLTHGKVALVDAADFEWLNTFVWTAMLAKSGWYAVRGGAAKHVRMHRFILGEPKELVDHWDHDGLNNTRRNLRVCTNAENMRNSGARPQNKCGYKGVFRNSNGKRWVAQITVDYRNIHLGTFDSPEEAARAYDTAAVARHGQFACLNFEAAR